MTALAGFPVLASEGGPGLRAERLAHGVARIVLARPELRNAFDADLIRGLTDTLGRLASDPGIRLLLLEGEGPVFCAGADLGYMRAQARADADANLADARALGGLFHALAAFPAPTLACVRGAAIGGGLGLVACCDEVLAEPGAVFATSEVRLGIVPAVIGPYVLRKVGPSAAAPLVLTGRRIRAEEALRLGLIHRLPAEGETCEEALETLVRDHLQAGPAAARRAKALLLAAAPLPDGALREATAQAIAEVRATPEAREGLDAFFAKQRPAWAPGEEA